MSQLFAIAVLRSRLLLWQLTSLDGVLRALGSMVVGILILGVSGVFAAGGWRFASQAIEDGTGDKLKFVFLAAFWLTCGMGIALPLVLTGGVHGLEVAKFIGFPISRRRLFFVSLVSAFGSVEQLFCMPLLLTVFLVAFTSAAGTFLQGLAFFVLLPLIVAVWAHALTMTVKGLTRSRRAREALGIGVLLVLVTASLLPLLLGPRANSDLEGLAGSIRAAHETLAPFIAALPPHLAAEGAWAVSLGEVNQAALPLAALLMWLFAGLGVGYWAFRSFVLGQQSGSHRKSTKGRTLAFPEFDATTLFSFLPTEIVATASKELLYLSRSVVGRVNLILLPAIGAMAAMLHGQLLPTSLHGIEPSRAGLYSMTLYAVLFSLNFLVNSFAWEGTGFSSYLLGPVRPAHVIVGKNLGSWTYASLNYGTMLITWSLFAGFPGLLTLLTASLLFAVILVLLTITGNLLSLKFPVARDMSGTMNQPSHVAILLAVLTYLPIVLATVACLFIPVLMGRPWLSPLLLLLGLSTALVAWKLSLSYTGDMMWRRREHLVNTLEADSHQ